MSLYDQQKNKKKLGLFFGNGRQKKNSLDIRPEGTTKKI